MPLSTCADCGGKLRRSRRTIAERFFATGAYRCSGCGLRTRVTSLNRLKHMHYAKCPRCSATDLVALRKIDSVDKMRRGPLNFLHRVIGGQLYHCWFCRLQFYDARPVMQASPESGDTIGSGDKPGGEVKATP